VALERALLLARLALPLRHAVQQRRQLALELPDRRRRLLALVVGQPGEGFWIERLATADRHDGQTDRRLDEREVAPGGALREVGERRLAPLLELLVDLRVALAVLVGFERGADGAAQVVDQARHVVAELGAAAGGQRDRARAVRLLEVEDVAPVERRRL